MLWLDVISRWIHVGFAAVLIGAVVFQKTALQPVVEELAEDQRAAFHERVMSRWRKVVFLGIGLLLLTGFYNYLVVMRPLHKGDGLYHALMGVKIILAFVVFFFASALAGRSAGLEGFRRNSRRWLSVLVILSLLIVAIGGFLKVARPAAPPKAAISVEIR